MRLKRFCINRWASSIVAPIERSEIGGMAYVRLRCANRIYGAQFYFQPVWPVITRPTSGYIPEAFIYQSLQAYTLKHFNRLDF